MFMIHHRHMQGSRGVARVLRGLPATEHDGACLHRVLGTEALDHIDPFLLFEEMRTGKTSDAIIEHPHAGFEILTLIMSGHADYSVSGREAQTRSGGAHWITAGRGVSYGMSLKDARARGFQLWLNLPAENKGQAAVARDIAADDIPSVIFPGAEVRVLAGRFHGLIGPVMSTPTRSFIADVKLGHEAEITLPIPHGHQGFVYVFDGGVAIDRTLVSAGQIGCLAEDGGAALNLVAGQEGARLIVATAQPLGEPIVRYGPFVMSDHDGIKRAFIDYQNGLF